MRKSPVPASHGSVGQSGGSTEVTRPPSRPALPPRAPSGAYQVDQSAPSPQHSPKPSARPPPRPPSIKVTNVPPPRPPPPSTRGDSEMDDKPPVNRSRPNSSRNLEAQNVDLRSRSPSGFVREGSGRSSYRNTAPYDPDLNPFGDEDEEDNRTNEEATNHDVSLNESLNPFGEDLSEEEDEDNKAPEVKDINITPSTPPPPPRPVRSSINPFLSASVKRKPAPAPPSPYSKQKNTNLDTSPSPPTDLTDGVNGSNQYANVTKPQFENEAVTSGDLSVTSELTNETQADSVTPPVTIVSVMLVHLNTFCIF